MSNLINHIAEINCSKDGKKRESSTTKVVYQNRSKGETMKQLLIIVFISLLFITACQNTDSTTAQDKVQKHRITAQQREEFLANKQILFKSVDAVKYYYFNLKELFNSIEKHKDGVMIIEFGAKIDGSLAIILHFTDVGKLKKSADETEFFEMAGQCPPYCVE